MWEVHILHVCISDKICAGSTLPFLLHYAHSVTKLYKNFFFLDGPPSSGTNQLSEKQHPLSNTTFVISTRHISFQAFQLNEQIFFLFIEQCLINRKRETHYTCEGCSSCNNSAISNPTSEISTYIPPYLRSYHNGRYQLLLL